MTAQQRRLLAIIAAAVVALAAAAVTVAAVRGDDEDDLTTGTSSTTTTSTSSSTSTSEATTTTTEATTTSASETTTSATATTAATTPPSTSGPPAPPSGSQFADRVVAQFDSRGIDPAAACNVNHSGVRRVYQDYGAVFLARGVTPPSACIFSGDAATQSFQAGLDSVTQSICGVSVTLQRRAMDTLNAALAETSFCPRGGSTAASRSYATTEEFWLSRVNPGLDRYVNEGRISSAYAAEIRAMSNLDQIAAILDLEAQGMLFGLNQSKTIMSSVAPPGSSQHLSLLALDVEQYGDSNVRAVLARHGWYRTIISDQPHFTFLGVAESELPGLGLRNQSGYWIPNV